MDNILDFWNGRAGLGAWAGTNDLIAKQIEMKAILSYMSDGKDILDVGCGNGIMALEIAKQFKSNVRGIDFSPEMIREAKELREGIKLKGSVSFAIGNIRDKSGVGSAFDIIYTERMLINLLTWEEQKEAITKIIDLLKPGGIFVMCENSRDGLDEINKIRTNIGLSMIVPPWHNRYIRDYEIQSLELVATLKKIDYYSSTYYLLSRVVNAWQAKEQGKDPEYNSPTNQLALKLPAIGNFGQGRIWVWRKLFLDDEYVNYC